MYEDTKVDQLLLAGFGLKTWGSDAGAWICWYDSAVPRVNCNLNYHLETKCFQTGHFEEPRFSRSELLIRWIKLIVDKAD